MAGMLSQHSTTGFYKAPVSKGIFGCMFLTSCVLNVPLLAHIKQYVVYSVPSIFEKYEVWRVGTSKITFLDPKDVVCGSLLVYYFRIFERRYGSHKFASFLFAACTIATILEFAVMFLLQHLDIYIISLPTGPYGLIFPLFVNYFMDIPRVAHTYIMGVPVTGKTLTYLVGLQVISANKATVISGICTLVAGIICKWNMFGICDVITIPKFIGHFTNVCLGWLFFSSPPHDGSVPVGATMEIQRQMQFEMMEQQIVMSRTRDVQQQHSFQNRQQMAQGYSQRLIHTQTNSESSIFPSFSNSVVWNSAFGIRSHQDDNVTGASRSTDLSHNDSLPNSFQEDQVRALVEMGFERQNAVRALQSSNNDIHLATTILLNEN